MMCRLMGVKSNSYYSYQKRKREKLEDPRHKEMVDLVKEISASSRQTYGQRRIKEALIINGYFVGRYKTKKLMEEAKVWVRHRKKFKVTTDSNHKYLLYENVLDRNFYAEMPDQVYVSDITYIWTQEGWLYLAVVIDLFSRRVVGWSMGSRMKADLVCDALKMAIWQRKPAAGLIVHSDRGSQYASKIYRHLLKTHSFIGSMSRQGDCWDNSVAESFFGSMKQERVQWQSYQSRYEAQQDVLNYISMFYNSKRLHSYIGYRSPMQFELDMLELKKVA
jgi:putative transposase